MKKYGEGDLTNGLINLLWSLYERDVTTYLIGGLFYIHGYRVERNREYGLDLIQRVANETSIVRYELAMLFLQGVFITQNVELGLEYITSVDSSVAPDINQIWCIKSGYYFISRVQDIFLYALVLELQLSDDFKPKYDGSFKYGALEQEKSLYLRHANLQNPFAMYCLAHMMESVDEAIYWLEQSLKYEFDFVFNELAYLNLVYTKDIKKIRYYSDLGAKCGHYESQYISYVLSQDTTNRNMWRELSKIPKKIPVIIYPYFFERTGVKSLDAFVFRQKLLFDSINQLKSNIKIIFKNRCTSQTKIC